MIDLEKLEQDFLAAKASGDVETLLTQFYVLLGSYAVIHTRWEILMGAAGTKEWSRIVRLMQIGLVTEMAQVRLMRELVEGKTA